MRILDKRRATSSPTTTVAPDRAKWWAMPRPMPRPAPVTMMTRPATSSPPGEVTTLLRQKAVAGSRRPVLWPWAPGCWDLLWLVTEVQAWPGVYGHEPDLARPGIWADRRQRGPR